ncbi:unnamed protein product, partial [Owenia fusiformis]
WTEVESSKCQPALECHLLKDKGMETGTKNSVDVNVLDAIMKQRQLDVLEACGSLSHQDRESIASSKNIVVNRQLGILFCLVPKVASTTWTTILLALAKDVPISSIDSEMQWQQWRKYFKPLNKLPRYEQTKILKNFYKFMFVRDPISRLRSAWKSKMTGNQPYFEEYYGKFIRNMYRGNTSEEKQNNSNGVTFHEFAQYVVDIPEISVADPHWR